MSNRRPAHSAMGAPRPPKTAAATPEKKGGIQSTIKRRLIRQKLVPSPVQARPHYTAATKNYIRRACCPLGQFLPHPSYFIFTMQFSNVILALTAVTAVSAANNTSNDTTTNGDSGAGQVASFGVLGAAAAAGVAMLI